MSATVVYIVELVESERGWGQRPDGYLAFEDEAGAVKHIYEATKDRAGPAPDVYTIYHKLGYRECSKSFLTKLEQRGQNARVYIDHLNELTL